jgi:hypothetical protein
MERLNGIAGESWPLVPSRVMVDGDDLAAARRAGDAARCPIFGQHFASARISVRPRYLLARRLA